MKRDRLHLPTGTSVETSRDSNGRYFIAYARGASVFLRSSKEVRQFLRLPAKIPSREAFDSWIASLEAQDAERHEQPREGLSDELLATGFGPEVHSLDESDPNHNTRTVI